MPNDDVPATDTGLPDDPRQACEEAISILIKVELSDAFMDAKMFARLIGEASGRESDTPNPDPVYEAIEIAAMRLEDRLRTIEGHVRRVSALCRHGTGKFDHTGKRRAAA